MSAKVLVLNTGSSSIKYQLFGMPEGQVLAKGLIERIGEANAGYKYSDAGGERTAKQPIADHRAGVDLMVKLLTESAAGTPAIRSITEIIAVGHRVVHGAEQFTGSVVVTPEVVKALEAYSDLAPLHNPPNVIGIRAAQEAFPGVPQVGCFDTAFHATLPQVAYLYALPYDVYEKHRVRRYGFHGTSHRFVARRAAQMMGRGKYDVNVITCHLGNGCSMAAIKQGRSVDTSMGLTPLEGLVMGTRPGDLDPGIVGYLASKPEYKEFSKINAMLNKQSGLLGLSGLSNDVRTLLQAAQTGNKRATLALDIFCYRIRKYIGSYAAVLPQLHAVVFTGGIGENAASLRAQAVEGLDANLGIKLDPAKNAVAVSGKQAECDVATADSRSRILVIPTNEEKAIAVDTYQIATKTEEE
jgi:acetate kinase